MRAPAARVGFSSPNAHRTSRQTLSLSLFPRILFYSHNVHTQRATPCLLFVFLTSKKKGGQRDNYGDALPGCSAAARRQPRATAADDAARAPGAARPLRLGGQRALFTRGRRAQDPQGERSREEERYGKEREREVRRLRKEPSKKQANRRQTERRRSRSLSSTLSTLALIIKIKNSPRR